MGLKTISKPVDPTSTRRCDHVCVFQKIGNGNFFTPAERMIFSHNTDEIIVIYDAMIDAWRELVVKTDSKVDVPLNQFIF